MAGRLLFDGFPGSAHVREAGLKGASDQKIWEFAGSTVLVVSPEAGVWVIKTATTIPDSEIWLHQPQDRQRLDRALAHAAERPAQPSDPEAVAKTLGI